MVCIFLINFFVSESLIDAFSFTNNAQKSLSGSSSNASKAVNSWFVRLVNWLATKRCNTISNSNKPRLQRQARRLDSASFALLVIASLVTNFYTTLMPKIVRSFFVVLARSIFKSLIFAIAALGLSFFGHTSTQFMMLWQRYKRYGSSKFSKRSSVA
jgi:ABC-type multidrug transport system fused ATPase/permease subunit